MKKEKKIGWKKTREENGSSEFICSQKLAFSAVHSQSAWMFYQFTDFKAVEC